MHKRKNNIIKNDCPICGGIIWGKGQKVLIEGAKITVCQNCAQHGKKIITKSKSLYSKGSYVSKLKASPNKENLKSRNILEPSMEIVLDYAIKIRNARMLKNLTQDEFAQKINEKPSLIRRIESGKTIPTEKLAKKIEKVYQITLLKKPDQIEINTKKYMKKQTGSSLGDIAFIKKKK